MIQWSPDTTSRPNGGGYDYADSEHHRLQPDPRLRHRLRRGRGRPDPARSPARSAVDPGSDTESFSHRSETASPGYYAVVARQRHQRRADHHARRPASARVHLPGHDVGVPAAQAGRRRATPYAASTLTAVGDTELTGSVTSTGFCEATNAFTLYFAIEFDQPFTATGTYGTTSAGPGGAYVDLRHHANQTVDRARRHLLHLGHARPRLTGTPRSPGTTLRPGPGGRAGGLDRRAGQDQHRRRHHRPSRPTSTPRSTTPELFPSVISDADGSYRGFDGAVHTVGRGTAPSTPTSPTGTSTAPRPSSRR